MVKRLSVLITGAYGQLGWELTRYINNGHAKGLSCLPVDIDVLDITDYKTVRDYCNNHGPGAIVNCAAYTAVDKAESESDKVFAVNERGPKNLALVAEELDVPFIHISTDFVFDGEKPGSYTENDSVNPLSIYGKSKLAGEKAIFSVHAKCLIIRTSWLYSSHGANFVKTILGEANKRGRLKVVADQVGTPTYAADLAKAIARILPNVNKGYGHIFHYSNEGVASWYDFAVAAVKFQQISCIIEPVETTEYYTIAERPLYTVLNKKKIRQIFGLAIPHWIESLEKCIGELKNL